MTEDGLLEALRAFETMVEKAQAEFAAAEAVKDQLRLRQHGLLEHEKELLESLDDLTLLEPWAFKLREVRLRQLDQSRKRLQPELANAAIEALSREEDVESALRTRAALELLLEDVRKKTVQRGDEALQTLALFELGKRLQRTS